MKGGKTKTLTFHYPKLGYSLICFEGYMYVGDLTGGLTIEPKNMPFGEHLFIAGESEVVQIGDERGSAVWEMLKLMPGSSLRYLGTMQGDVCEILLFQPLEDKKPKHFQRNLFGDIGDLPYKNLYVAFNYLSPDELHITTRCHAARVFRPTVIFAP